MRHIPASRSFSIEADGLLGYGKPDPARKWWLDVEKVDGLVEVLGPFGIVEMVRTGQVAMVRGSNNKTEL